MWLVQTSGFNTKYINQTIDTLKKLKYDFNDFGIVDRKISNLNNIVKDNTQYISRGGVLMLDILKNTTSLKECSVYLDDDKNKDEYITALKNSIDYTESNFDQKIYKDYNLPLLNSGAEYYYCDTNKDRIFEKDMFIKPSRDLKSFAGGIIPAGTSVENYIKSGYWRKGYEKETLVVSPLINIYSEYRFFIIEDRVISGSLYKRGKEIIYDSHIPKYIMEKAKEYARIYSPESIFVMDLAETDNGIKIVEYNCWNCSGLYNVNTQKLFYEINEYKGVKYE